MPQTVEAEYRDGVVHLKKKPVGIKRSKALVVFLDDADDPQERHPVNLDKVRRKKSSVDRWIGVIEGAELGDWKAERRAKVEESPGEGPL